MTTELQVLQSFPSFSTNRDAGFLNYLRKIKSIPCLTPEEEHELSESFAKNQDIKSAHRIILSHLKLVAKIATGFKGYGFPMVELVSEGNIGLMQALKRFKPELGFRFSTYCIWWVKASIQEYILKSWSLVKMGTTAAQKKIFFNLGKVRRKINIYEQTNGRVNSSDVSEIAINLGVSEKDVIDMSNRMSSSDYSLNDLVSSEGSKEMIEMIPENEELNQELMIAENQEISIKRRLLSKALENLSERERMILMARRLRDVPETLENLSSKYQISRERVRQIELKAFDKVKNLVALQYQSH